MPTCYLGLGSNLKTPQRQLRRAIKQIKKIPKTHIIQLSSLYKSYALGMPGQPNYCNMVIHINTHLRPLELLTHCQHIEKSLGRVRKKKWGPRTIDIDILLYDTLQMKQKNLTIPHQEMHKRDFVLIPLIEINPNIKQMMGKHINTYIYP